VQAPDLSNIRLRNADPSEDPHRPFRAIPQAELATDARRRRRRANPLAGDEDNIEMSCNAQQSELL